MKAWKPPAAKYKSIIQPETLQEIMLMRGVGLRGLARLLGMEGKHLTVRKWARADPGTEIAVSRELLNKVIEIQYTWQADKFSLDNPVNVQQPQGLRYALKGSA